jgi:hypothetical protein
MAVSKGELHARSFLKSIGIADIQEIPIDLLVYGAGAMLVYRSLKNCDGRIVFGKTKTLITINSDITYEGKLRFTIAHELGHLIMHRNKPIIHFDNDATLEYFKKGHQETEANEFASELLMPAHLFLEKTTGKPFNPPLLRDLAQLFFTSITSVAYKYCALGNHPICLIYIYDGRVKYCKKSDNFNYWVTDREGLTPPTDSVAYEYIQNSYQFIYSIDDSIQPIQKSTWLTLSKYDEDTTFYEYCIVTKQYKTILSVIWED